MFLKLYVKVKMLVSSLAAGIEACLSSFLLVAIAATKRASAESPPGCPKII
jgi:hypothetical protein